MSDAIALAVARKIALDSARQALSSRSRAEMTAALEGLPPDGTKAERLRENLLRALEDAERLRAPRTLRCQAEATCVSDGVKYDFKLVETGDIAFFNVKRVGSLVSIAVNSSHPFGQRLLEAGQWNNPVVLTMLAAWAHYELDQSDDRRQRAVGEARVDWGRVVRRLLVAGEGFTVA